jgi:hypothetical protein
VAKKGGCRRKMGRKGWRLKEREEFRIEMRRRYRQEL